MEYVVNRFYGGLVLDAQQSFPVRIPYRLASLLAAFSVFRVIAI